MSPRTPYQNQRRRAASWAAFPAWLAIAVALFGVPVHALLLEHGHSHAAVHCHDVAHAESAPEPPASGFIGSDAAAQRDACALCEQLLTATATPCAATNDLPAPVPAFVGPARPHPAPEDARPCDLPARAPPLRTR